MNDTATMPASRSLASQFLKVIVLGSLVISGRAADLTPAGEVGRQAPATGRDTGPLSDSAFWRMVSGFSEAGGSFPAQNFVSNEVAFQTVIPALRRTNRPGGVYVGVGPDQNFTYIAALRPRWSFIIDIRRQNLLQHLLYKALFEIAPTRADFLARLFSRPRADTSGDNADAATLVAAYASPMPETDDLFSKNVAEVFDRLERRHGFQLTPDDERTIELVYRAFFAYGPTLTYAPSFLPPTQSGMRLIVPGRFPTFADLMTRTDDQGTNQSYLATDANYRFVRDLELQNRVIPIVGDFAGDRAIAAVGKYLKQQGATVTAFYTSNVEQYLFRDDRWREYYRNVASLPLDDTSTFIRAYFPGGGIGTPVQSSTRLCSMIDLLAAVKAGKIRDYSDVVDFAR